MTGAEFDKYLETELCWTDGFPTVASHAGQRQCPHCRRKWSYVRMLQKWLLAKAFCAGLTRKAAAAYAGTEEHTAGRHYQLFQKLLFPFFVEQMRRLDDGFYADPERFADSLRSVLKTADPKRRFRIVVDFCLGEMAIESRLELLFRLAFRDRIQELARNALSAKLLAPHRSKKALPNRRSIPGSKVDP